MNKLKWNENWSFWNAKEPEIKKCVTLPHDAMLTEYRLKGIANGVATGFFPGGKYYYEKIFWGNPEYEKQRVLLEFEGVYMNSTVYLNGEKVGGHIYGYTDFFVDLTNKIKINEENNILVEVDNTRTPNSRWYSGSGIYRDVFWLTGNEACILPDGVQIQTLSVNPVIAEINVQVSDASIGKKLTATIKDNQEIIHLVSQLVKDNEVSLKLELPSERITLWSDEHPNLYDFSIVLGDEQKSFDEVNLRTGIRMLTWSAENGLQINGKTIKLRGGCIHHDHGALGAVSLYDAEKRRALRLKEMGFNAIRYAHNPAGKVFLDVCDEVGLYVMDESFDQWKGKQSPYDYGMYFEKHWEEDLDGMIRMARNHPSVIMYSIGNEISDVGQAEGAVINQMLTDYCHEKDSSRPVINCINPVVAVMGAISKDNTSPDDVVDPYAESAGSQASGSLLANIIVTIVPFMQKVMGKPEKVEKLLKPCFDALDIVGYNYAEQCYDKHHKWNPNRLMVGSETYFSHLFDNWKAVEEKPYLLGDFMWTAWDYLGEAGVGAPIYGTKHGGFNRPYPCVSAGCGIIDKTGIPQTSAYYAAIIWGKYDRPYIGVRPVNHSKEKYFLGQWRMTDTVHSWSWDGMDGKRAEIEVYAAAAQVELIQDGKSLGRNDTVKYIARFQTTYRKGTLVAISYDEDGNETGRDQLISADNKTHITLLPDRNVMKASTDGLIYVDIQVTDEKGIVKMLQDRKIQVQVDGAASLAGLANGNPFMTDSFTGDIFTTYQGQMQAIVRGNGKLGKIVLTVYDKELGESRIILYAE